MLDTVIGKSESINKTLSYHTDDIVKKYFKSIFTYNPITGIISDNKKEYHKLKRNGYCLRIRATYNKIRYSIQYHRLCWYLYYNDFLLDSEEIDHKDNNRSNNCITNLRKTIHNLNSKKLTKYSNGITSKYKGVTLTRDFSNNKELNEWIRTNNT